MHTTGTRAADSPRVVLAAMHVQVLAIAADLGLGCKRARYIAINARTRLVVFDTVFDLWLHPERLRRWIDALPATVRPASQRCTLTAALCAACAVTGRSVTSVTGSVTAVAGRAVAGGSVTGSVTGRAVGAL